MLSVPNHTPYDLNFRVFDFRFSDVDILVDGCRVGWG